MTKISEITSSILVIGEETADSEENEDISALIKSLTMFESNVLGITKSTLGELNSKISALQTLVAEKKVVKGITQLSDLSSMVQSTIEGEISMIVADNAKKDTVEIKQKYKKSVTSIQQVFADILEAVGDSSTGESIESEEIKQATIILQKISDSSATEEDLQTLDELTAVLQETTFEQGAIITNLESATTLASDIDESLAGGLAEDVFDLTYADDLFAAKEEVSLLSHAESTLTSTLTEGADISDEAFVTVLESIKEIKEQTSSIMSSSFSTTLEKLLTGSTSMTQEKKVEGLKTLQRMIHSAIVTQSLSISQGSASQSSGATFEMVKKAEEQLSGIEVLLTSIKEKVSASDGSGTSMEFVDFTNFQSFLQQEGAYDSEDIAFMISFSEVLTNVISKLEEGGVTEIMMLDELMTAVKEEKTMVSNEVITAKRNVIKEKQSVYSEAACKTIRSTYQSIQSLAAETSGEVSEVTEVTDFYFKLQKIDVATMTAAEIKMIEEGMASITSSISTASGGVAFLSNIIEKLAIIDVRGAEIVERKKAVGNSLIIEKSLGNVEDTLQTSLKDLSSIETTIGVLSDDAEYTEDATVTEAYNLLVQYSADLRLVPADFGDLLGAFDFTAITGTKGTGIKYFKELISLITQYTTASQQSKEFVAQSEALDQSFELESSITRTMDALGGFVFGASGSTGDTEETTDTGGDDQGAGGTGDMGGALDSSQEQIDIFNSVFNMVSEITLGSMSIEALKTSETVTLIEKFLAGDINTALAKIEAAQINEFLSSLTTVKASVSADIKSKESKTATKSSFNIAEETSNTLDILKSSINRMSTKKGSTDTADLFAELETLLKKVTNVFLISNELLSEIRTIAFQLSTASTSEGDTDIGDVTNLLSSIDSVQNIVQAASSSQSAFLTAMETGDDGGDTGGDGGDTGGDGGDTGGDGGDTGGDGGDTSGDGGDTADGETGDEIGSSFGSSLFSDVIIPESTLKISQQAFISSQLGQLMLDVMKELETLKNGGGSGSSGSGGSDSSGGDGGDGSDTTDGTSTGDSGISSEAVISRVNIILQDATTNINNLQYSTLMACGAVIQELRLLGETEGVVVDTAAIDTTLTAIESTEQTLKQSIDLLSSSADASTSVLVTQESSAFIANMEVQFQSFIDAVGSVTDESSVIEDSFLLEQANLFTSSLTELSLMSTTISQETLQVLKSSSESLFTSDLGENPRFVPGLKAAAYFVLDSGISLSEVIGGFAVGSTLQKSQTQEKLFVTKGAQTILEEFSVAMTGIKESGGTADPDPESASVVQIKTIIQDSRNILEEWTSGNIQEYQVEMCRGFLQVLPSLTAALKDIAPLPELEDLAVEMEGATQSIMTTTERITMEEMEDEEDAVIDGVFMYCGQLESFAEGIVELDENGNEVELEQVDAMLTLLKDVSADPVSIDMASVQETVKNFMNVMQGVEAGSSVKNYKVVVQILGDITNSLASTRQSTIFTRGGEAALAVMGVMPFSGMSEEGSTFTPVLEVQEMSMMVSSMTTSIFSSSRGSVRELAAAAPKLQMAVEKYNGNIASLSILEENLAIFSRSMSNFAFYTTQEYNSMRTSEILKETASIIEAATTDLKTLTMSMGSVMTYESNDQISKAFDILVTFASDLSALPFDLKTQLEEIDFSTVTLPASGGTGIEKLFEVYTMMDGLNEAMSTSTLNTQYMESLAKITPANGAMTSIISSLTSFMTIPSEEGDGSNTDGGESVGDGNGGDAGEDIDVNAIIADIQAAAGNLFAEGLVLPEGDMETLVAASETLSSISATMGGVLEDIPGLISELSETSAQMSQLVRGYGTAVQNRLMYSSIEDIATMSTMIKSAVNVGVPDGAQSHVDSMVTIFESFVMGSAFISQDDVVSLKSLAYEFSAMADGNAGADVTMLMELIDQTENVLLTTQGFLSSQQLFFDSMMEKEFNMEIFKAESEHNSAYQQYYFLGAMDSLLMSLTSNLTGLIDAGGSGEEMNKTSLTSIRAALTTAGADMGSMDMNLVSGIGMSLIAIQEAQTNGLSVNVTEVENLRSFVESVQVTIKNESSMMEGYGRTVTDVFAAQDALNILDAFENEAMLWFAGDESAGGNGGDESAGGNGGDESAGGNGGDESAGGNGGDESAGGNGGDNAAGDSGDEGEENSLQSFVSEVSDILLSWTFDSSAVDGSSVVKFKRTLKKLTSMFDVAKEGDIPELQIWQYSTKESSLSELITDVYLGTAQEGAGIEEVVYRFDLAYTVLEDLLEILEGNGGDGGDGGDTGGGSENGGDGGDGGDTGGGSENGGDGGDTGGGSENGGDGSDGQGNSGGGNKKEKKAKEMNANRLHQITTEMTSVLNGLEAPKDIRQDQIKKMKRFGKELKSLMKVEGAKLGDDDGAELKTLVQQKMDSFREAKEAMTTYSEEVSSKVQIMKEISFFQEIMNFLQYSTQLLDTVSGNGSGASGGTTEAGDGSEGGTTEAGDGSEGGTTESDGGENCSNEDSVLCASQLLLESLQLAETESAGSEGDAAGGSASEGDAAGGSNGEGESSDSGAGGMGDSASFRYQNVRGKIHDFSKAMRHFSKEESGSLATTKNLIGDAKAIAEKFVTDLTTESNSMTSFTDVSAHYTVPEVTVTTSK
ncbi:location of vulva defective 1-like [Penaeus indicus]|uniref:location of vulva defective 1-like n=1 Tax=Penaeus indicus TaxID=29960 RepID=UPI00300C1B40